MLMFFFLGFTARLSNCLFLHITIIEAVPYHGRVTAVLTPPLTTDTRLFLLFYFIHAARLCDGFLFDITAVGADSDHGGITALLASPLRADTLLLNYLRLLLSDLSAAGLFDRLELKI